MRCYVKYCHSIGVERSIGSATERRVSLFHFPVQGHETLEERVFKTHCAVSSVCFSCHVVCFCCFLMQRHRKSVPIDLGALLQLEIHAKQVAGELSFMMDNLRNSLHAVRQLICKHGPLLGIPHTVDFYTCIQGRPSASFSGT